MGDHGGIQRANLRGPALGWSHAAEGNRSLHGKCGKSCGPPCATGRGPGGRGQEPRRGGRLARIRPRQTVTAGVQGEGSGGWKPASSTWSIRATSPASPAGRSCAAMESRPTSTRTLNPQRRELEHAENQENHEGVDTPKNRIHAAAENFRQRNRV